MQTLTAAFAREVDRVALFGSGSGNEPTGLVNTSGVVADDMDTNGAPLTDYSQILAHLQALADANVDVSTTASLMAPRTQYQLAALTATDGQPLMEPAPWAAQRKLPTTGIPVDETQGTANDATSIISGDFRDLYLGFRMQMEVRQLVERYADTYETGFLAVLRMDVAVARPGSFRILRGITG